MEPPQNKKRGRGRPARCQSAEGDLGVCLICVQPMTLSDSSEVSAGLTTVRAASARRRDNLTVVLEGRTSVRLHKACRKAYINPEKIQKRIRENYGDSSAAEAPAAAELRSAAPAYVSEADCILCGNIIEIEKFKKLPKDRRQKQPIRSVETLHQFECTLRNAVRERGPEDLWAYRVQSRYEKILRDFPSAEVKYHSLCYSAFIKGRNPGERPKGRPAGSDDTEREAMFARLCLHIDRNDECQYSLGELEDIIRSNGDTPFSRVWLKNKLVSHYRDSLRITESSGKNSIFNFSGFFNKLLYDKWYDDRREKEEDEKRRIVKLAAKFVLEEIRQTVFSKDEYSSADALCDESLPDLLQIFLNTVVTTKARDSTPVDRKRVVLGQAVMLASRPKSYISPLLLNIGTSLYREFPSRELIDTLHHAGLSHGYDEVRTYVFNLAKEANTREKEVSAATTTGHVQYVFDNADWNTATLTGEGTTHVLVGERITTPAVEQACAVVPRLPLPASSARIASELQCYINVEFYRKPAVNGLSRMGVLPVSPRGAGVSAAVRRASALDALWLSGRWAGVPSAPSWSGFMKKAVNSSAAGPVQRSGIEMLPIVNMDPTNMSSINTSLIFAARDSRRRGQKGCFVTFDNGLYPKAIEIVSSDTSGELQDVVVRLGGFHLLMSYMGALGYIYRGSGIDDLWAQVYARCTVVHMMSGKAYARALRAHFLTQEAVGALLLDSNPTVDSVTKADLCAIYIDVLEGRRSPSEVADEEVVQQLAAALECAGEAAARQSRTGRLWWQYYKLVALIRLYVRAERIGDTDLHVDVIKCMEPIFHAAAHLPYAKSARHYVQVMEDLPEGLQQAVRQGFFTARRTAEPWSGIWTDMSIEQDVMRTLKIRSGLCLIGRGFNASALAQFVGAMPALHKVCVAVEKYLNLYKTSSEQHVELRSSRRSRDQADLDKLTGWLRSHSPFTGGDGIRCISTGVLGSDKVNCDSAVEVGTAAMQRMVGKNFANLHLARKDRVIPLEQEQPGKKGREEACEIDTNAVFMRMCCLELTNEKLREYLRYELTDYPPALFDCGMLRHNVKSNLVGRLLDPFKSGPSRSNNQEEEADDVLPATGTTSAAQFATTTAAELVTVVDGGYLLHVVAWPRPTELCEVVPYRDVISAYVKYVERRFGARELVAVVFDGYDCCWSTKDEEHRRRASKKHSNPCPNIDFDEDTTVDVRREQFLSNNKNKSRLIGMLEYYLKLANVSVYKAQSDADVLIAETALSYGASPGRRVSVVATDTDILTILVARAEDATNLFVIHPGADQDTVYDIAALRTNLDYMVDCVLVSHALSGCDTTSAIFNKGKNKLWDVLAKRTNHELRDMARKFNRSDVSREELSDCGEKLVLALYPQSRASRNSRAIGSLDELRFYEYHKRNSKKASLTKTLHLAILPPTSDACRQHTFRAYLQVQEWLGNKLCPTDWGWRAGDGTLFPTPMALPCAPQDLLERTSCGCTTGCLEGSNCSCREARGHCNPACEVCRGLHCSNTLAGGEDYIYDEL